MSQPAAKPKKNSGKKGDEQRPEPLWGAFPLVQISVFAGLVLLFVGMFNSNRNQVLIGLGLGCLGGLELAIREHFTGYRSHTSLLSAVAFGLVMGVTSFVFKLDLWICLVIGAVVAAGAAWLLLRLFRSVSGGLSYRLR